GGWVLLGGRVGGGVWEQVGWDMVARLRLLDIIGLAADDEGKLDFEVHALPALGHEDRVVGSRDAGGRLGKDDRCLRNGHAGFFGMVPIVQPDAEKLRHPADGGSEAGILLSA